MEMPLSLFMGEKSSTGAGETEARFQKAEAQRQDGLGRLTWGVGAGSRSGTRAAQASSERHGVHQEQAVSQGAATAGGPEVWEGARGS